LICPSGICFLYSRGGIMKLPAHSLIFRALVAGSLAVFAGGIATTAAQTATSAHAVPEALRGSIQSPPDDARVPRSFAVEGTVTGKPRHLWLAVRIGDLYWPREPQLAPTNGKWAGEVREGGNPPNGRFEVVLIDVPQATSAAFAEWLRKGHLARSYPGIRAVDVEGAKILDRRSYQLAGS
jgi:hypothetical protein